MRRSVYVLTALFTGVALGVFAAELRIAADASNDLGSEPLLGERLTSELAANPGRESNEASIHNAVMDDAGSLGRLLQEMERAAQERRDLVARQKKLQMQVRRLEERLAFAGSVDADTWQPSPVDPDGNANPTVAAPSENEDRELQALLAAGLDAYEAADIRRRAGEAEMERLYLRDRAIREGWFGSERYQEELETLEDPQSALRARLGEQAFDRYLYASGEDNRIRVQSVIEASPAAAAGLASGDIIHRYANKRIFTTADLRSAMAEGNAGESISVEVSRDGSRRSFYLNRGPLGVRLGRARVEP